MTVLRSTATTTKLIGAKSHQTTPAELAMYLEHHLNGSFYYNYTDMSLLLSYNFSDPSMDSRQFSNSTSMDTSPQTSPTRLCGAPGSFPYTDLTQIDAVWWMFVILYTVVMTLSLVGNMMVIWTICRHKYMRTVTNYYILNLAVCDFLVSLFVMPLKLMEYAGTCTWQLVNVDILCSVLFYILPVFVFASVFTLVAISLER